MRGISKKIIISLLTSVIVLITMVATTFAWVGIFTYASVSNFDMNLKVQKTKALYYLTISGSGKSGTFGESVDTVELERQILKNRQSSDDYSSFIDSQDDNSIETIFSKLTLTPLTTTISDNSLSSFQAINYDVERYLEMIDTNGYYKFDLYFSVDTKDGINLDTTEINAPILMTELEDTLVGSLSDFHFTNGNPFLGLEDNPKNNLLKNLPLMITVNSANAMRVAFEVYDPINITDEYAEDSKPSKLISFQGGTNEPELLEDGSYSLGGVLEEERNSALQEILVIRPYLKTNNYYNMKEYYQECLSNAIERGKYDKEINESNRWIRNYASASELESGNFLGVHSGVQTKQKITVYFWAEGWDSDCLIGINDMPVTLNLTFTADEDV